MLFRALKGYGLEGTLAVVAPLEQRLAPACGGQGLNYASPSHPTLSRPQLSAAGKVMLAVYFISFPSPASATPLSLSPHPLSYGNSSEVLSSVPPWSAPTSLLQEL